MPENTKKKIQENALENKCLLNVGFFVQTLLIET